MAAGLGFLGDGVRTDETDRIGDLLEYLGLDVKLFLCGDNWLALNTLGERADLFVGDGVDDIGAVELLRMCWGIDAGAKWAIAEKRWVSLVKTLKIGSLTKFSAKGFI